MGKRAVLRGLTNCPALDSFDPFDPKDPIDQPRSLNRYAPPRVLSSSVVVSRNFPPTRGTILAPASVVLVASQLSPTWRENSRSEA